MFNDNLLNICFLASELKLCVSHPQLDLHLQYHFSHELLQCGWELSEGNFCPVLQDKTDDHYIIPIDILKGCSFKKKCPASRRCGCYKSPHRGGCSAISCKNCSCYSVSLQLDHLHIEDVVMPDTEDDDTQTEMEVDNAEAEEEEEESDWETDDLDDDILPVDIGD